MTAFGIGSNRTFARTYTCTPYDIPDRITQAGNWMEFGFTGNGQRAFERDGTGTTPSRITYYAGPGFFEQDNTIASGAASVSEVREYLATPAGTVGVVITNGATTVTKYYLQDHLGSNIAAVDETGGGISRNSYDVWGVRTTTGAPWDNGDRGYTGHEHLNFGLIHMNGRVYDPRWRRFLQADPIVQSPYDLQSYNRYAYVMNNPLSFTDPTGFSRWTRFRDRVLKPVAIAVAAWYTGGLVSGMITDTASAGTFEFVSAEQAAAINTANALAPAAGGAASGFAAGGLQGGNLQSAVASAVSGVIAGGINGFYGSKYPIDRIAANSVSGGISSALQGGRFQDGFKSSLTTSLLTYANVQMRQSQIELSLRDPEGRSDGRGWSRGLFGDLFKLGGGRYDDADRSACSPFGCQQRGPGSIAGIPYASGGLIDMVVESFAGPHDSANQRWFYNSLGQIREMSNRQSLVGELFGNYSTSLIFAAPFAIAAVREQTFYGAYKYAGR